MSRPAAAIVGLGVMGSAVASRLIDIGWRVVGYDVDPAARESLGAAGGEVVACPAELMGSPGQPALVLVLVRTAHQAETVFFGEDGLAAAGAGVAAIMSTLGPSALEKIVRRAPDTLDVLDAPISGGVESAVEGLLTVIVSGRETARDRARSVFDALGRSIVVGDEPGLAQAAKLVNQAVMGMTMAAVAEAMHLAERLGLSEAAALEVLSAGTARSWVVQRWERLADYWMPGRDAGSLELVPKDIAIALEEVSAAGGTPHDVALLSSTQQALTVGRHRRHGDSGMNTDTST